MCCARHHKPQHQLPLRQGLHRRHRSCTCPSSTPFRTHFFNQFCPTGKDLAFVTCSGPDMMFPKGSPAVWEIDSLEGTWFRKYKIVQIHHLGRNFHCNYTITTTTYLFYFFFLFYIFYYFYSLYSSSGPSVQVDRCGELS